MFPVGPVMPRRVLSGEPGAGTAAKIMHWMISAAGHSRRDRRFSAPYRNILPGTSEQTQEVAIFTPCSGIFCCSDLSHVIPDGLSFSVAARPGRIIPPGFSFAEGHPADGQLRTGPTAANIGDEHFLCQQHNSC